ncbi:unnamed protein product [Ceratitis capitata]|uniref:(Mediterranean fruit fly) hypothetical protein n=1 Tax=Ceratitis capitata TaxID=7213 RepID=A0A811V5D3_CERCA|nr:unnamed protein product [Ceratitis capitata]
MSCNEGKTAEMREWPCKQPQPNIQVTGNNSKNKSRTELECNQRRKPTTTIASAATCSNQLGQQLANVRVASVARMHTSHKLLLLSLLLLLLYFFGYNDLSALLLLLSQVQHRLKAHAHEIFIFVAATYCILCSSATTHVPPERLGLDLQGLVLVAKYGTMAWNSTIARLYTCGSGIANYEVNKLAEMTSKLCVRQLFTKTSPESTHQRHHEVPTPSLRPKCRLKEILEYRKKIEKGKNAQICMNSIDIYKTDCVTRLGRAIKEVCHTFAVISGVGRIAFPLQAQCNAEGGNHGSEPSRNTPLSKYSPTGLSNQTLGWNIM